MYKNTECRLQAHRGVSTEYPENTMLAFRKAVEEGYDVIEFDPKMTRDGVCVVLHDFTLERTGRIAGQKITGETRISEIDYRDLRDVDVGEWKSPEFAGVHIPTLSQALDYMKSAGIEAKIDNVVQMFSTADREKVFDIVEKHGAEGNVGLTCSDLSLLKKFAERFPGAPLHYDGPVTEDALRELKTFSEGHKTYVWMRFDNALTSWNKTPSVDKNYAERVKRDFLLGIWILSDESEMENVLRFAPDIVETTGGIKPAVRSGK